MEFSSPPTMKRYCTALTRWFITILILLFVLPASAQRADDGPFAALPGKWSGAGTITMSNGSRERIRCEAEYRLSGRTSVRVDLTCASDSYRFELRSNTTAVDRRLSGTWNEVSRGAGGEITGRIVGERLEIRAEGQTFTALLDLTTRGTRQTISIRSPGSDISEVAVSLTRRSR